MLIFNCFYVTKEFRDVKMMHGTSKAIQIIHFLFASCRTLGLIIFGVTNTTPFTPYNKLGLFS